MSRKLYKSALTALLTGILSLAGGLFMSTQAFAAAGTYYKWTGASSATAGLNGCTTNCWSVAGNWDVSNDGGVTYAAATTAPQSSDNSGAGDNLVFDNTGLSANATLNDDIASLTVDTVNFTNSATSFGYTVNAVGAATLTVTGGLGTTSANAYPQVTLATPVVSTGTTTFGTVVNGVGTSNVLPNNSVTVSSGTLTQNYSDYLSSLTIASGAALVVTNGGGASSLAGSGSVTLSSPSGSNSNVYFLNSSTANTFSGSFDVKSGSELSISNPGDLGTASLTIESGGQLNLYDSPSQPTSSDSMTIANTITMGGSGAGSFYETKGAITAGLYDGKTQVTDGTLTVTLSGAVTLTSDTALSSIYNTATTYNFTGALNKNGHNLSAIAMDQPTYGTTNIQVNGTSVLPAASAPKAPGTPNTGLAPIAARPVELLAVTSFAALFIGFTAFRLKSARR